MKSKRITGLSVFGHSVDGFSYLRERGGVSIFYRGKEVWHGPVEFSPKITAFEIVNYTINNDAEHPDVAKKIARIAGTKAWRGKRPRPSAASRRLRARMMAGLRPNPRKRRYSKRSKSRRSRQ